MSYLMDGIEGSGEIAQRSCASQFMGAWAMEPMAFKGYFARVKEAIRNGEARLPKPNAQGPLRQSPENVLFKDRGGVRTLAINGPLTKHVHKFEGVIGGTSMSAARTLIEDAISNDEVEGVMLHVDSPGGSVAGTGDLGDAIRRLASEKPVFSFIEDLGASAAFWLASQGTKVFASRHADIGSIGVMAQVFDTNEFFREHGVRAMVVSTGDRKGDFAEGVEVTPDMLEELERRLIDSHNLFVSAVAKARGLQTKNVDGKLELLSRDGEIISDGRVFIAQDPEGTGRLNALDMGLIDEVTTDREALQRLRTHIHASSLGRRAHAVNALAGSSSTMSNMVDLSDYTVSQGSNTAGSPVDAGQWRNFKIGVKGGTSEPEAPHEDKDDDEEDEEMEEEVTGFELIAKDGKKAIFRLNGETFLKVGSKVGPAPEDLDLEAFEEDHEEAKMVVPSNPEGGSGEGEPGSWSSPAFSDFTENEAESWEATSDEEKLRIHRHYTDSAGEGNFTANFDDDLNLPHHWPDNHASAGQPSFNGVVNAKARLNQTQGLHSSEEDIMAHLNAHVPPADDEEAQAWDMWVKEGSQSALLQALVSCRNEHRPMVSLAKFVSDADLVTFLSEHAPSVLDEALEHDDGLEEAIVEELDGEMSSEEVGNDGESDPSSTSDLKPEPDRTSTGGVMTKDELKAALDLDDDEVEALLQAKEEGRLNAQTISSLTEAEGATEEGQATEEEPEVTGDAGKPENAQPDPQVLTLLMDIKGQMEAQGEKLEAVDQRVNSIESSRQQSVQQTLEEKATELSLTYGISRDELLERCSTKEDLDFYAESLQKVQAGRLNAHKRKLEQDAEQGVPNVLEAADAYHEQRLTQGKYLKTGSSPYAATSTNPRTITRVDGGVS